MLEVYGYVSDITGFPYDGAVIDVTLNRIDEQTYTTYIINQNFLQAFSDSIGRFSMYLHPNTNKTYYSLSIYVEGNYYSFDFQVPNFSYYEDVDKRVNILTLRIDDVDELCVNEEILDLEKSISSDVITNTNAIDMATYTLDGVLLTFSVPNVIVRVSVNNVILYLNKDYTIIGGNTLELKTPYKSGDKLSIWYRS